MKTELGKALKNVKRKSKQTHPVWKGPEEDGITQSLLGRFLVCRERFRLLVVEGLQPAEGFNHRLEFGNMWHLCEEAYAAAHGDPKEYREGFWRSELKNYAVELIGKYRNDQPHIEKWYQVCKVQFPIYIKFWAKNRDRKQCISLLQEEMFRVAYKLPSGRVVTLRGKWDSVDLIGRGRNAGIYLGEHKTKGTIDEGQLQRQLQFDLQTMFYLVALQESMKGLVEDRPLEMINIFNQGGSKIRLADGAPKIRGVRYNVIRRPLSGGKGSIVQLKPTKKNPDGESAADYYTRLGGIIEEQPEHFFMRWQVEVTQTDIDRFKREFLNPILEQLCDWWKWVNWACKNNQSPFDDCGESTGFGLSGLLARHWRHPFGVWNSLNEGRASELDEYLASGNEVGLERTDKLFTELE